MLVIFTLSVAIYHIMCSYIEALCQIVEQSDNYFWGYCIFKNGDTKSVVFKCLSGHWQIITFTDTAPLS